MGNTNSKVIYTEVLLPEKSVVISLGQHGSKIYSADILKTSSVMEVLAYFRDTMKISFGLGSNDTIYIISDEPRPEIQHYYNLPLNVTYNEYNREILVTEFFPEEKIQELSRIVSELLEEKPELDFGFLNMDNPYLGLKNWLLNEENRLLDSYSDLSQVYLIATHKYKHKDYIYNSLRY